MAINKEIGNSELVCRHCNRRFNNLHGLLIHLGLAITKVESFEEIGIINNERARVKELWEEYSKR